MRFRILVPIMTLCLLAAGASVYVLTRKTPAPVDDPRYPVLGERPPIGDAPASETPAPLQMGMARNPDPREPDPGLERLRIPDFTMIDQEGRPVDATVLDGELTVIDFIFTNCPTFCPGMTRRMAEELQRPLEGSGVQFLSISVDPVHDTPEILKAWGAKYGADFANWRFINGAPGEMQRVADALHLFVGETPDRTINMPGGGTMLDINHPTRFVLVDGQRRALGMYRYNDRDELAELRERIRAIQAASD